MSLEDWSAMMKFCHARHVWMASAHFMVNNFFIRIFLHLSQMIIYISIRVKHIAREENRLADYLSRWHIHSRFRDTFLSLVDIKIYEEVSVHSSDFNLLND